MNQNYFLDKDFLYKLIRSRSKEIYAKIIALNFEENPLQQIEGKVTGGSLNIDGSSSVRRTCNLTLVAKDVNISDFYWSVSNKFTLEIGVKNFIDEKYPEIIWFPQGIFVISSFNVSLASGNYNISIGGKDKMCLLNGDMGGNLHASVDFGKIDSYADVYNLITFEDKTQYRANKYYIYNNGEYEISISEYEEDKIYYTKETVLSQEKLKLKDIIREAIHVYGKEMYHNIIINDLDDYGLELVEYRGEDPLYILYNEDAAIYDNMTLDKNLSLYKELSEEGYSYTEVENLTMETFYNNPSLFFLHDEKANIYYQTGQFDSELVYYTRAYIPPTISTTPIIISDESIVYNNAINDFNASREVFYLEPTITFDSVTKKRLSNRYSITKVLANDVAGYRTTDLTYAGELISSIGESLTSILDKIKNMLGPFEYFYDIDGHFVFQAKKIYANESWNTLQDSDDNIFARDVIEESPYSFSFEDVQLIQQFQNAPAIGQIKNDYSIWGVRKGISGAEIPIHARYAIHDKPIYYKGYDGVIYCQNTNFIDEYFDEIKEERKARIEDGLDNFTPEYPLPEPLRKNIHGESTVPQKTSDGSWTAGWWDIRDWAKYYEIVTDQKPSGTMKFYSKNDLDIEAYNNGTLQNGTYEPGYVPILDLGLKDDQYQYNDGEERYKDRYAWLIIYSPSEDIYKFGHGSGKPDYANPSTRYYYESWYLPNGSFDTSYADQQGNIVNSSANAWKKPFIAPYSGCTDSHTYLKFLENDVKINGNLVYFYNPNFPGAKNLEEAIENELEEEKQRILNENTFVEVDWREIIYQMAKDYFKHNQEEDFLYRIKMNNLKLGGLESYYPTGETGYEMFYTDIQGFWRQLYDPNPEIIQDSTGGYYTEEKKFEADDVSYKIEKVWNPFQPLETFSCDYFLKPTEEHPADEKNYSKKSYYWNKNTVEAPELLNFWIDFYDGDAPLKQYSISNIGNRPKVVNNNKVSSIYFRNIPQVIFYKNNNYDPLNIRTGYTYINLSEGMEDLFTISSQGKSAQDELNELFNDYSYCTETVTMNTIPIYYLEPNTIAYIHNEESGINGKY